MSPEKIQRLLNNSKSTGRHLQTTGKCQRPNASTATNALHRILLLAFALIYLNATFIRKLGKNKKHELKPTRPQKFFSSLSQLVLINMSCLLWLSLPQLLASLCSTPTNRKSSFKLSITNLRNVYISVLPSSTDATNESKPKFKQL